jgi:hypothetical protein
VVKEAIEDGGGDGAIAVEDSGPLFKGFVGGDDDQNLLIHSLREQVVLEAIFPISIHPIRAA